ncbi:6-bladed beta-propeller [Rubrivivax sp. A210]|uniref:6-bladed beta-propeller n=1 Tax=Rubrivivax sp. A210 TaxID=2772301 RepID=UPI001F24BC1E|nr:6-bladed beta-propeller [Rubrivivax sp. A210]
MNLPDACRRASLLTLAALTALGLAGCASPPPAEEARVQRELVFPPAPDEPRFVFERTIRSSADILPEEKAGELRRLVTGEDARGEPLSKPYAVAATRGRLYVSDTVSRFVRLFDVPQGKQYRVGDEEGAGQLIKPIGVDVDAAGNLYVADIGAKAIMVYGPGREFLRKIGGDKFFSRLSSVTVDPAGDFVYGIDIGGVSSDQHHVRVFNARTGEHVKDIGKRGSGPGEFNLPRDLAIGAGGRLYVVDGGNFRVVVFDKDGRYLQSFGSVGKQYGQFARPKEIAADRDGNVYVVDAAFGNFQVFNPDGELLLFVGDRSERDGPAKYMLPSGIAVDEDGRVYVVDQWFRKIDVYRPASLKSEAGWLAKRPPPVATR